MKIEEIRDFEIDIERFPDSFLELHQQERVHAEIEKTNIRLHSRLSQQGGYDSGNLVVNLSARCFRGCFTPMLLFLRSERY
ncbi:hypothetical protein D3C72_2391730 [compost metagenome]